MSLARLISMAALLAALALPLHGQQPQPPRPTVGLALSGGGALGLAHIGVLRYMEEHRIPADRIAGTSMGGLIGGLYATGHDAAALDEIIRKADWAELLRTAPAYADRPVVEKQDWNRITGRYSFQLGNGLTLPAGINRGQALALLLSRETAAYADVRNFDDLPIPFRCVGTDLVSGEAFVLREGSLPKAMRATMAMPGIFTPVDWDGRVLSDGGIVNNLPTEVVRQMGADTIIAVTLRVAPASAQDLYTIPNILRQTANIAIVQNEMRSLALADIEISVPLGTRGTFDFNDTKSIIELGYAAAVRNQAALEKLSLPADQWEDYVRSRKARERTAPDSGPIVDLTAADTGIRRDALSEMLRKTGPATSRNRLEDTLSGLTAATGLPNAFYGWHTAADGKSGYRVELEMRRDNELLVRPSFFYQLSPDEPSRATFRLDAASILKNAYKSRVLANVYFGGNPGVFLEYYRPFGGSAAFVAPGLVVQREHLYVYDEDRRADQTRDRFATSLYFGLGTWRHLQLRLGAQAGLDRYSRAVRADGLPVSNTLFANPEIKGIVNTQDSGLLPSRGFRFNASSGWSFRDRSFPYLRADFDHFHPAGREFSIFATGRLDSSMGRSLPVSDQFRAGGLMQLDAYRYHELRGDTLLIGGAGALYRGANPNDASFRPIFASWYQAAGVDSFNDKLRFKQSAAFGVFVPTPLGLAGLTVSSDFAGSTRFRLSIGSFWNRP